MREAVKDGSELMPLEVTTWTLSETLRDGQTTNRAYLWFSDPQNSSWAPLYELTAEDIAAVNAARKERASKALRRLDLCRCDHNQYCGHCYPVEFRPGGVWGGNAGKSPALSKRDN